MGKVVDFRQKIIDGVKALYPNMDVDWYDGLFDEQDIADWTLKTPCARVAVMASKSEPTFTGELNALLRVVVVLIDENRNVALDGDARAWDMVETVATWAHQNQFGHPDAAPAQSVQFKRISQPVLRREGVSVGVVEWQSDLMIGTNKVLQRDFVWNNGQMVTKVPSTRATILGHVHTEAGLTGDETVDVTPEVP
ncbi:MULTISPECIES: hypothetical protein [unclassified Bradyrhizobium]|uniref:hypothetical protein n=1 Tax=unclassified Bradyrhizobium TaxID=2631580 RepID=UPI002916606A|nr:MULTISPECIES: hypothetical protein [unclassified Bradyrhizobium]